MLCLHRIALQYTVGQGFESDPLDVCDAGVGWGPGVNQEKATRRLAVRSEASAVISVEIHIDEGNIECGALIQRLAKSLKCWG